MLGDCPRHSRPMARARCGTEAELREERGTRVVPALMAADGLAPGENEGTCMPRGRDSGTYPKSANDLLFIRPSGMSRSACAARSAPDT